MPIKKNYITLLFAFLFMLCPSVIKAKEVILGGDNIGIRISNEGVVITDTYVVRDNKKVYNPSADSDIRKGDIIVKIEDKRISNCKELMNHIKERMNKKEIEITIMRNKATLKRNLNLINVDGKIKTGLYIKDSILGIGTITYYDLSNKTFGALGHEMTDSLNKDSRFIDGNIYKSSVRGIKKSIDGIPGEKIASIDKESILGDIKKNNMFGIYGRYVNEISNELIETASIDEIKKGKAYIYTVLDKNKIDRFEIEITNVKKQDIPDIKGISFKIVDKRLLNLTNGIVAGMSGSPIVQDNKLIGAVTHVKVNKVNEGYGIYIDWMLKESSSL